MSPTHSIHVDITYTSNHLKYKCNTTNIDTECRKSQYNQSSFGFGFDKLASIECNAYT